MRSFSVLIPFFFFVCIQFVFSQEAPNSSQTSHPLLKDKYQFEAGLYFPSKSIFISANGSTPNELIDFGKSFDFNTNETTPEFGFKWFFLKKWHLSLQYFGINNSHKAQLEEDINFGDYTFKAGSYVRGGFKLHMFRIFAGRDFIKNEKHDFGVGLGFHALNIGPFIEGNIQINDQETSFKRVDLNAMAPLPNIGIWYFFSPGPKWLFSANLDWFGIEFGEYSVSLWDTTVGINFQVFKNIGLYANYRFFKIRADVNQKNWNGTFSFKFSGPSIGVTGNF